MRLSVIQTCKLLNFHNAEDVTLHTVLNNVPDFAKIFEPFRPDPWRNLIDYSLVVIGMIEKGLCHACRHRVQYLLGVPRLFRRSLVIIRLKLRESFVCLLSDLACISFSVTNEVPRLLSYHCWHLNFGRIVLNFGCASSNSVVLSSSLVSPHFPSLLAAALRPHFISRHSWRFEFGRAISSSRPLAP